MKKLVRPAGILIIVFVALGMTGVYYKLGGFNKSSVRFVEDTTFHLCGVYYEGKANRSAWSSCFDNMEELMEKHKLSFEVAAYYYQSPAKENNHMVKAFVGALLPDSTSCTFSDTLEYRTIKMKELVHGEQEASIVVTSLFEDIEKYADKKGLLLDSVNVMEHYPAKDRLIVYWPLQGKGDKKPE